MKLNGKLLDALAILIFIGITFAFFGKLYSGDILVQTDIQQYQGMSSEIEHYKKQGENIHWTNSAFAGMPTYLLGDSMYRNQNLPQYVNYIIRQVFPGAAGILLIGLICFYILMRTIKVNRWLSIIASFCFGAGTFVITSLLAGHTSKINAYAYAPLILAGLLLIFKRKPWSGVFLFAYGLGAQIAANHLQITFYTFLICLIFVIVELVRGIKKKDKKLWQPFVLSALGALIAIGINYNKLYSVYQYAKHSTRGGESVIKTTAEGEDRAYNYATQWSYKPIESFTLLIPNFMGGASNEELGEKSSWYGNSQIPRNLQTNPPTYWGQMPFTGGPAYLGASLIALFFFGSLFIKSRWKWWIGAASLLLLFLSWGKFSPIYDLFYHNFPFFNKFRTPMMSLLMLGILFPLLAMKGSQKALFSKKTKIRDKDILIGFGIPAVLIVLFGFLGSAIYSFEGAIDQYYIDGGFPNNLIKLLRSDRKSMLIADSSRSIVIVLLIAAAFWAFMKGKIKRELLIAAIALFAFLDLFLVNQRYSDENLYVTKSTYEQTMKASALDKAIQQDGGLDYRVLDITSDPFKNAITSLHHKSLGGYHAAKLQSYDDLIELKLRSMDMPSLNMLNTSYILTRKENGEVGVQKNDSALGNAWFVKEIKTVTSPLEAIETLGSIDVSQTALVQSGEAKTYVSENDSTAVANIELTSYHPENMVYKSSNKEEGFAVFSEIFYSQKDGDGWQAFVDGQEVPIHRTNFLLRGIEVPAGEHELVLKYRKAAFQKRSLVSRIFSGILFLVALGYFGNAFFNRNKKEALS